MKKIFPISLSLITLLNIYFTNGVLKFQQKAYAENFVTNNINKIENPVPGGESREWKGHYIYFGNYPTFGSSDKTSKPIRWCVLDKNNKAWNNSKTIKKNGFVYLDKHNKPTPAFGRQNAPIGGNSILLMASTKLCDKQYHPTCDENDEIKKLCWGGNGGGSGKGCTLWAWLNNYDNSNVLAGKDGPSIIPESPFLATAFTIDEQSAIMNTKVYSEGQDCSGHSLKTRTSLTEDKIFILSAYEILNEAYGFQNEFSSKFPFARDIWSYSWLRTPHFSMIDAATAVWITPHHTDMWGCTEPVNYSYGVVPAFNLNSESVIFISKAAPNPVNVAEGWLDHGVKNSVINSSPIEFILTTSCKRANEYKLTLHDKSRNNFTAKKISQNGNEVTISYNNATTGNNEYISCLILDEQSEIKYYGKLKQLNDSTTTNGSVTLNIPEELQNSKYSVEILNEQCNGDYKTDFSSKPIKCI